MHDPDNHFKQVMISKILGDVETSRDGKALDMRAREMLQLSSSSTAWRELRGSGQFREGVVGQFREAAVAPGRLTDFMSAVGCWMCA